MDIQEERQLLNKFEKLSTQDQLSILFTCIISIANHLELTPMFDELDRL